MESKRRKPKPGEQVVLTELPPGLIDGLPRSDQKAIAQIVGKPILLEGFEGDGRAELMFVDSRKIIHFIFVDPKFIRSA